MVFNIFLSIIPSSASTKRIFESKVGLLSEKDLNAWICFFP